MRKPRYKPRPKHPIKVHVWAGISMRSTTSICISEGRMNTPLFVSILEQALIPFMRDVYPDGCRLVQDNDPKHNSATAHNYYKDAGINWWRTPPESPDLNPIENLWHELKEYIRCVVKPTTKQRLISGINEFWETVTPGKCTKYIKHLEKVNPQVICCSGNATGY